MSSHKRPQFGSNIPEHLLANESPAMCYLMNELSKNTQATEYLLDKRTESGEILDTISKELAEIRVQTQKTNGSVLRHTAEISKLNENKEEVDKIVAFKLFVQKYLLNRYFLIGLGVFAIGFLKIMADEELRGFFFRLLGLS